MIERGGPRPDLKQRLAKKGWDILTRKLGLEFSEESRGHLIQLNEQLLKNSAVVYINHTAIMDAPVVISMVLSQLTNAKNVLGLKDVNTAEINPESEHLVIDIMEDQKKKLDDYNYGGSMRLGAYPAHLEK